jgi:arylsulfatase A-like enzyme
VTRRTFFASTAAALAAAPATAPPNIVLIMTDDQGWWDVGVQGNRTVETPVMDRLAADGVRFSRFYACPVCAPTRASLLTGRYYLRTGVYNTRFGGDSMDAAEVTLAQALRGRGYRTGIFGKWHLGPYHYQSPLQRGFDHYLGFTTGHTERYYYPDQIAYDGRPVRARGHITDVLTDGAISFLEAERGKPFFLYLAYNVPHSPNFIDNPHVERYLKKNVPLNDAQIYGMISHCDAAIGRVLGALDRNGLRDNTIVLFLSDNGGVSKYFRAGLRGAKGSAYEGGIRVPFFARWPGRFPAGATVDAMASVMDLFPTLCRAAGATLPPGRPLDGKSILHLLEKGGGESPHEYLCHIWDRFRPSLSSNWSITEPRFKLAGKQLFDLANDIAEERNIAAQQPEVAARLRRRFEAWLQEVTAGRDFQPAPIEIGRPGEGLIEIQPSWARVDGTHVTWSSPGMGPDAGEQPLPGATGRGTNYTFAGYEWDTIDGWSKPGDRVEWSVRVLRGGTYRVSLSYGCLHPGGVIRISTPAGAVEHAARATGGRNLFQVHAAGALRLAPGAAMLRVEVLRGDGREVMALNKIRLERAG